MARLMWANLILILTLILSLTVSGLTEDGGEGLCKVSRS